MQDDITRVVEEMGGEVLGAVRHPLATADFASGKRLETATPADDPNRTLDPPKPTA